MKKSISIFLLICTIQAAAQVEQGNLDLRFGTGISLLGSGDMTTLNFENEINYRFNQLYTSSFSINYGRSNSGVYKTASFVQGNLNAFISLFRNNKRNDFRIGTGLSYYNISDAYRESAEYTNGLLIDEDYKFNNDNSLGINLIVENTYSITDRFLIGLKLFSQSYLNEDINTGILLKFGLKL